MAKGGGKRQQVRLPLPGAKAVLKPKRMLAFLEEKDPVRSHRGVPAVPPGWIVVGGTSAE